MTREGSILIPLAGSNTHGFYAGSEWVGCGPKCWLSQTSAGTDRQPSKASPIPSRKRKESFIGSFRHALFRLVALLLLLVSFAPAHAADDKVASTLTSKTMLAYVRTGDRNTDQISEAGLNSLARILQRRTSIDQIAIAGVNPDSDELAFYPLLYWPISAGEAPLSPAGASRVNDYLHHGGMIFFDTLTDDVASAEVMKHILVGIDLPPLAPINENHVLKRSFYLLDEFPGRYAGHDFWVEGTNEAAHDSVATVLLGENGYAAAWAADDRGNFMYPCVPGGEAQREQAFRFGVNLVMYALTGNYKSDQLHAEALLKKLGK